MIPAVALVVAYMIDLAFGEPRDSLHPVAWIGRLIGVGRDFALGAGCGARGQLLRGALVALAVPAACAAVAAIGLRAASASPAATLVLTALLLKPTFAVRALRDAAFAVRDALGDGDVDAARGRLGSLCSRDASTLGASALVAAAVESVAENLSDSVVAPLFYFVCFGVPGAVFYRAVNTLDAMIGYRGRYEYVGKVAAKTDDVLNLVPAWLTAALLLASGAATGGGCRQGLRVLLRDGGLTESPNAGRPMAAMAGLLGVRLTKVGHYALGDANRPCLASDVTRAWRLASIASLSAVVLGALVLGASGGPVLVGGRLARLLGGGLRG